MSTQPTTNTIKATNPTISEENARAFLASDVVSNGTTLTVVSTRGLDAFTGDFYAILEEYGDENAEIVKITAASTTTTALTCSALKFSHGASTPVTYIPYNQVKFYGVDDTNATNILATLEIDVTSLYTSYTYSGDTYTSFCTAYYNSNDAVLSAYSEVITASSFTRYSVKKILLSAARKALTTISNNQNSEINWDNSVEVLQDGIDEILARKRRWEFLRKTDATTSTTVGQNYATIPTDCSQLIYVKIDTASPLNWASALDYSVLSSGTTVSGTPSCYTIKGNRIYFDVAPDSIKTITYEYYKDPATITTLATAVDRPFAILLMYYCAAQFCYIRGNDKRGDRWLTRFEGLLERQCEEYSGPEQDGWAEYVEETSILNDANLL